MHAKARWVTPAAAALITLGFSGCSASNGSSTAATSSPAPAISGQSYTTRAFSVPLTITVPASFFKAQPNSDTSTLLTWVTGSDEARFHKVRFLLPDALYRPGQTAPEKPPKDYLTYLRGLSRQGATLADEKKITVDGHSATLMTGTTEHDLDGSIGCPQIGGPPDAGGDCFGFGPAAAIRIAVIDVSGRTLVSWAGIYTGASDESAFFAEYEAMLQSIKFR
jgi:hypothetical protein